LPQAEKVLLPKEKVWRNGSGEAGQKGQLGWLYLIDIEWDIQKALKGEGVI
jgi:hypothetical protein